MDIKSATWPARKRRLIVGLAVAASIGLAFSVAFCAGLLHSMQLQSSDLLFRATTLYQAGESDDRIVVVSIDDKSLEQLGHFSLWPRSHHAQIIDRLVEAGARIVVFDILFAEPMPGDETLAASIKEAGNVILPVVHVPQGSRSAATDSPDHQSGAFLRPVAILEEEAAALGHASVFHDTDGVVRRLPTVIADQDGSQPALALAAVAKYLRRADVIESPIQDNALALAGRSIPISGGNAMLINYTGGSDEAGRIVNFESVSYVDALRAGIDPEFFEDKLVIIGVTASGMGDAFWTPMAEMMHGVEIHATAIHTILSDNFLRPAPAGIHIASILILALLCGLVVLRLRLLWAAVSAALLCFAYLLIASSLFDHGIILNVSYPPLTVLGAFVGMNIYSIARERSEKRELTKTFGRYISPAVVDRTLAALEEGKLRLGGDEQEVTVAFADMRGFVGASEKMRPDELVRVLNTYLSKVIEAVINHDGMINKFGGDSVMAVWNAPTACEGHSLLAVRAAIDAQHAVEQLHEDMTIPKMDFGIGINTGQAVAGNMGSEDRLEYSVIGDAVNTAARLADATPGGKIWIGSSTFEMVKDHIRSRSLGELAVKGRQESVQAYEVVDALDLWINKEQSVTNYGCLSSYS